MNDIAIMTKGNLEELYFERKLAGMRGITASYYRYGGTYRPKVKEPICLVRFSSTLRMFQELPLLHESLGDRELFVLVPGLRYRLLNLQSLDHVRYVEDNLSVEDFGSMLSRRIHHGTHANERDVVYLTDREREVFLLVSIGLKTVEIAEELGVTVSTVNAHKRNLFDKFHVHSSLQLVKAASTSACSV